MSILTLLFAAGLHVLQMECPVTEPQAHFDLTKPITVNFRSSTDVNGVFMENGLWYNKVQFNFRGHVCLVYT